MTADRARLQELRERAAKEPLEVDLSDFGDEYVCGFLAGQVHALNLEALSVDALLDALDEAEKALRYYARLDEDAHGTGCLRNVMHWPDEDDGKPGFERTVGGPDAECSCEFAIAREALARMEEK